MKTKKIPLRTCCVSNTKCEKKDLFRVVRTPDNRVVIDESFNLKENGHGAYLKKDKNIIEKARTSKILNKHLEINVPEDIYDKLIAKL